MTVTLEPSISTQLALSACCTVSAILGLRSCSETCLQHHSISTLIFGPPFLRPPFWRCHFGAAKSALRHFSSRQIAD